MYPPPHMTCILLLIWHTHTHTHTYQQHFFFITISMILSNKLLTSLIGRNPEKSAHGDYTARTRLFLKKKLCWPPGPSVDSLYLTFFLPIFGKSLHMVTLQREHRKKHSFCFWCPSHKTHTHTHTHTHTYKSWPPSIHLTFFFFAFCFFLPQPWCWPTSISPWFVASLGICHKPLGTQSNSTRCTPRSWPSRNWDWWVVRHVSSSSYMTCILLLSPAETRPGELLD